MYNLKTYAGRLKALSEGQALLITPEFNDVVLVNMHTLEAGLWAIMNTSLDCVIVTKATATIKEFDDACTRLSLQGVMVDSLRLTLFGSAPSYCPDTTSIMPASAHLGYYDRLPSSIDMGGKPC